MLESPGAVVARGHGEIRMWEWVAIAALGAAEILRGVALARMKEAIGRLEAVEDARFIEKQKERNTKWDAQVMAVHDLFLSAERYVAAQDVEAVNGGADAPIEAARADLLDALARSEFIRGNLSPTARAERSPFQHRLAMAV